MLYVLFLKFLRISKTFVKGGGNVTKHCIMSQLKVGITKGSVTEVPFPGLPPSHKLITVVIIPLRPITLHVITILIFVVFS